MSRKRVLVIGLVLLSLLAGACGTGGGGQAKVLKVAVIMPSTITDLAFSQSMYDALVRVQKDMGGASKMELAYSENMFVVDDAAAAIRDYASRGYNLIIAHGSQYGSSLKEIAPDFPKTVFAHGTTVNTFKADGINNVYAYEAASQEGGYVNGIMAGKLTKSNVIGVVGPIETGDAKLYIDGFVAGVKASNPNAKVNVNYIGSFSDVALASEAASTHIAAGADVLTGSAQMVVGAIGKAKDANVLWFGTQASQAKLAPNIVVSSLIYDWTPMLKEIIAQIDKGVYGGTAYVINLKNKGQVMEFNSGYALSAGVKKLADDTINGIINGTIVPLPK
jgi:basic membrane lipoprotein Med (substrate-binding protein (PBP1-ABC) superfamily)